MKKPATRLRVKIAESNPQASALIDLLTKLFFKAKPVTIQVDCLAFEAYISGAGTSYDGVDFEFVQSGEVKQLNEQKTRHRAGKLRKAAAAPKNR